MKKEHSIYNILIVVLIITSLITIKITNYNKYIDSKNKKTEEDGKKLYSFIINNTTIIDSNRINKKTEGKLVLARGLIDYNHEGLQDDLFDINVEALLLLRTVEVYQWEQIEEHDIDGKVIYKYEKKWSKDIINSENFKDPDYKNPNYKKFDTKLYLADKINLGKFELSHSQKMSIPCSARLKINKNMNISDNYKIYDDVITNSEDPENPEIGDIRISYCYNDWENITILAEQTGNSFKTFKTDDNIEINYIKKGYISLEEMVDTIINQ